MVSKKMGYLSLFLGTLLCLGSVCSPSKAQTSPPPQYQAIQLSDQQSHYNFSGKVYVLQENQRNFTIEEIEKKIRDRSFIPLRSTKDYIDIGSQDKGTWIVLPIVNQSQSEIWSLHLGSPKDGRFSVLDNIVVYNMNTKQYDYNSFNTVHKNKTSGNSLTLKIPAYQTSFFILYAKPSLLTPTYLKISLSDIKQDSLSQDITNWLCILLAFSGFVYFLKSAKDRKSLSDLFLSFVWLSFSVGLFIHTPHIYIGSTNSEIVYPLMWIFAAQFLMISFMCVKESQKNLSIVFLGGISSASFIMNLVGVVIIQSIPSFSIYLVYIPVITIFLIIMGITWGSGLSSKRYAYTHIANTAFFFFILLAWMAVLNYEIVSITSINLMAPLVIMGCAVCVSIISHMPPLQSMPSQSYVSEDNFTRNQISKKDIALLHEAKEKSEHHRLMQVIEQERKLMADLQVKSALQNEDMRKTKEAALEATRAKSAFLAVVSHEIRTPMTGIMGMLRLLQDTQLSKEQKEYTSTIKDSGDAMLALLNDILDFEKIESGKMDLENINFDLKRLVRSVYTLMRGHAESKNIELVLEIDSQVPNWVYGDPTRMRQVLLNLINNAIKFTSKGTVYLRVRDLTGETEKNQDKIHQIYFAVQDSGIGIGPENQKKLFMPFAQADTTISRKYGGTGLGLTICKRLIEAMGGAISINSKEGEGSTFFFTISMKEGNEIDEEGTEISNTNDTFQLQKANFKSSLNVLIVDDNGINQKVVTGFIEKLGARCMAAGNGADALDLHSRYPFDMILLDIELPDMNGMEITKIIRGLSIPSKANLPIIALTGNTQDEDIKDYLASGMDDVAAKPITFEKISELLQKVENQYYTLQKNPQDIDFSDSYDEKDISPLSTYTTQLNNTALDSSWSDDEDDDDSFAVAVKNFEKIEAENLNKTSSADLYLNELSASGLDEKMLQSLKSSLTTHQIQEILVSFYEKADELIADIGNAYLNEDAISLNARAHELKGMAGNFGFADLSQKCGFIEKCAKDNDINATKDAIQHLGENYAMARGTLNKWLAGQ